MFLLKKTLKSVGLSIIIGLPKIGNMKGLVVYAKNEDTPWSSQTF